MRKNDGVTYENQRIDKALDKVRDKVLPEPRTLNPDPFCLQGLKGDRKGQVAVGGGGLFAEDEFALLVRGIPFMYWLAGILDLPLSR